MADGWAKKDTLTKRYSPTELVLSLASGFTERDEIVELSREHLLNLGNLVNWPISLCTKVGLKMMVKCSTHSVSPFALDLYEPGYTLPILESAAGKTMLAYTNPHEVSRTIEAIESTSENYDSLTMARIKNGNLFSEIREAGYGIQIRNPHTNTPRKTSSIAVPILMNGEAIATISLIIIATAMDIEKAVEDFLNAMKSTAEAIASDFSKAPTKVRNKTKEFVLPTLNS